MEQRIDRSIEGLSPILRTDPPMERTSRGGRRVHPPPSRKTPFHKVTQLVKGPYFSVVSFGSKPSVDKTKKGNLPSVDVRRTNPSRIKENIQPTFLEGTFCGKKESKGSINLGEGGKEVPWVCYRVS